MQHTQYPYQAAGSVIDKDVILVRYQLTGTRYTARFAQAWMIGQTARLFRKQLIEGERGGRVVGFDVVVDVAAVLDRLWRPDNSITRSLPAGDVWRRAWQRTWLQPRQPG